MLRMGIVSMHATFGFAMADRNPEVDEDAVEAEGADDEEAEGADDDVAEADGGEHDDAALGGDAM